MNKKLVLFVFLGSLFSFGISGNLASAGQTCETVATGHYQAPFSPVVVQNYEAPEYVDGLLRIHFRFNYSGYSFSHRVFLLDDTCYQYAPLPNFGSDFLAGVVLPPTTRNWSVRFTSPTHFEYWDDDTETKIECPNCERQLPDIPGYYSIVSTVEAGSFNILTTKAYSIIEPPIELPILEDGLTAPAPCPSFQTMGPLFDSDYAVAKYENGLLSYHFRRNSISAINGVGFPLSFKLYDQDCNFIRSIAIPGSIEIPPYFNYWSLRFASSTHFDIWDDLSNTKINCIYCSQNFNLGGYSESDRIQILSNFIYSPAYNSTFASAPFPIEENAKLDPVIIIPGILGSAEKNGEWVIDPIFHVYDNLIETLEANGYVKGVDLFTFPYDWRNSNASTSVLLHQKIDAVQAICDCEKVDLVAHSMGGLAARDYIQGSTYEHDVDQLIFLGTPHLGSPDSYFMWEAGRIRPSLTFFGSLEQAYLQDFLSDQAVENGYTSLFNYVKSFPIVSVRELLSTSNYLEEGSSGIIRQYPERYPRNTFIENLNTNVSNLFLSDVEIINIVGDTGFSTVEKIKVIDPFFSGLWEHGYPENFDTPFSDHGLKIGRGDNTVPLDSASFIDRDVHVINSKHRDLPTSVKDLVFNKLTGEDISIPSSNSFISKILYIRPHSPVDILITAPGGKKIGKNFVTGEEYNEIDGAFYSGYLTDNEYITIPNPLDGEYKIETQGTGDGGIYEIVSSYINDATSTEALFKGNTAPGLVTTVTVLVSNENPEEIAITPDDTTAPQITITSPVKKEYLRSEILQINVSAVDMESGLFLLQSVLDGAEIENSTTTDLFFRKLGNHVLNATATDFLNNQSGSSTAFRIIATPDSVLSDIERAYSLGWIKSLKTKKELINGLNLAIKLEKRIEYVKEQQAGKPPIIKKVERWENILNKALGRAFVLQLEVYLRRDQITQVAYDILLEDINWLLDN